MQGWSIRLFRVAGIQLAMHLTFLLLLVYVAWEGWRLAPPELRAFSVLLNVGYVLLLFVCVVLHEFGHAFMARRFGIRVPRILLLPIGGMAEFESIPREPAKEIAIALAGPAVNFVLVGLLLLVAPFPRVEELGYISWDLLPQQLIAMNLLMGCFNLIPAFPMDGGRVLRAILARRMPYVRATFIAASIGKLVALAGVLVMALYLESWSGVALFLFILVVGEMEYRAALRHEREEARWRQVVADLEARARAVAQ